jgi:hypothetical protein
MIMILSILDHLEVINSYSSNVVYIRKPGFDRAQPDTLYYASSCLPLPDFVIQAGVQLRALPKDDTKICLNKRH